MSIRNSRLALLLYRFSDKHLLPLASRYFRTPIRLTTFGAVLAAGVPLGFLVHPAFGCLLLILSALTDVLDGHFARSTGQASDFGAFWDSSLDRISDFFYLMGFWILFRHDPNFELAFFLIGFAIITTVMISYVKARAESLGKSCLSGLMERGLRTIFLIIWALSLTICPKFGRWILWMGLTIFCILNTLTIVQRIVEIRSQFPPFNHTRATPSPNSAPKE